MVQREVLLSITWEQGKGRRQLFSVVIKNSFKLLFKASDPHQQQTARACLSLIVHYTLLQLSTEGRCEPKARRGLPMCFLSHCFLWLLEQDDILVLFPLNLWSILCTCLWTSSPYSERKCHPPTWFSFHGWKKIPSHGFHQQEECSVPNTKYKDLYGWNLHFYFEQQDPSN